jgi:hypothetical protein
VYPSPNTGVDWRAAAAIVLVAVVCAQATVAGERETPEEFVLRSLGHLQRGEATAVIPLFSPESLPGLSLEQIAGAVQLLGLHDEIDSQLLTSESGPATEGVVVTTIIYHLVGPETALIAVGQVKESGARMKLTGLSFRPAPSKPSELFPFVLTGVSYVHYYVLIGLFLIPALMLYATVQCVHRESGTGWFWIPVILIGVGRATAVWIPGPADERLFSFVPTAITMLGIEIQRAASFQPWNVSVSAPLGAILYLSWSSRGARTPTPHETPPSQAPDRQSP